MSAPVKVANPALRVRINGVLLKKTGFVILTHPDVKLRKPLSWFGHPIYAKGYITNAWFVGPFIIVRSSITKKKRSGR